MMTQKARERIIDYLMRHPEGVDDDILATDLGLSSRQQVNIICRQLRDEGLVERQTKYDKLHNFWIGKEKDTQRQPDSVVDDVRPWDWEGNVQNTVVKYLLDQGYTIVQAVDTASKETGKDIIAEREGRQLWVTVKGFPRKTEHTNPSTQAGHYFESMIFDILVYRGEDTGVALAAALPDHPRYRRLADRVRWSQGMVNFAFFWVKENGTVLVE